MQLTFSGKLMGLRRCTTSSQFGKNKNTRARSLTSWGIYVSPSYSDLSNLAMSIEPRGNPEYLRLTLFLHWPHAIRLLELKGWSCRVHRLQARHSKHSRRSPYSAEAHQTSGGSREPWWANCGWETSFTDKREIHSDYMYPIVKVVWHAVVGGHEMCSTSIRAVDPQCNRQAEKPAVAPRLVIRLVLTKIRQNHTAKPTKLFWRREWW